MPTGVYERTDAYWAVRSRHGHTTSRAGMKGMSPTYRSWVAMTYRCTNPNGQDWKNYGGRGIEVCERWRSFQNFLADMGERPEGRTLDRIDNNGNYEPGNCRWATRSEQAANRRRHGTKLTAETAAWIRSGNGLSQKEMAAMLGCSKATISAVVTGRLWA